MNTFVRAIVVGLLAIPFAAALSPSPHALAQNKERTAREKSKLRDTKDGAKPTDAEKKPKAAPADRRDAPKPKPKPKPKRAENAERGAAEEPAPKSQPADRAARERDGTGARDGERPSPPVRDAAPETPRAETTRPEAARARDAPKQVPGANRGVPKNAIALANRLAADVKRHRVHLAQLERLERIFRSKGNDEQLARTLALRERELALHAERLNAYRKDLGDDLFARANAKLDPKKTGAARDGR